MRKWISVSTVVLMTACGRVGSVDTSFVEVSTTTITASTTTVTEATTSTAATTTSEAASTISGESFQYPFIMEAPADDWQVSFRAADWLVEVTRSSVDFLVISAVGAESVDEWQETLTTDPSIVASAPTAVEIGGESATVLDIRLAEGVAGDPLCNEPCRILLDYRPTMDLGYNWSLVADKPNRVWLVAMDQGPVAFFAEASEARFADWTGQVEAALATLQWTE